MLVIILSSCAVLGVSNVHPRVRHVYLIALRSCGRGVAKFGYAYARSLGWDHYADALEVERYEQWLRAHAPSDGPRSGAVC